jgi:hypothetical protein
MPNTLNGPVVGVDQYDLQTRAYEGLSFNRETVVLARYVAPFPIDLDAGVILPSMTELQLIRLATQGQGQNLAA